MKSVCLDIAHTYWNLHRTIVELSFRIIPISILDIKEKKLSEVEGLGMLFMN